MNPLLLLLTLLALSDALAQDPADALRPMARTFYDDGLSREAAGDLAGAEMAFQKVYDLEPAWKNVIQDLGRVREARDDVDGAIRAYQRAPFEADSVEALARLYYREALHEMAASLFHELRDLRPGTPEFLPWEAAATLHFDPREAELVFREYLAKTDADLANPDIQQIALDLVNALYEDDDRAEDATALLAEVVQRLSEIILDSDVDPTFYEAIMTLGDRRRHEQQARDLLGSGGQPLPADQLGKLNRARAAYARRDLDEAAVILEEILLKNRNNAATWAALSAVREDQGRISEAEQAIVMADKLAPFDAVYPARLGAILAAWYGGRQDDNAVKAYRRALQRPGRNPHLLYALGKLEQRGAGNPEASLQALKMFLVAVPEGEDADRARQQIENLLRARPPELHAPPARARPADVSTLAWFEFHLAYIYFEESTDNRVDDDDVLLARAVDSILLAREDAPDFIDAINLEAQIRVKGAEFETAIALWERSLALDGDQAAVVLDMAGVHGQLGNTVRQDALLSRAEALGDPDTLLKRAHQQRAASEWWAARETLERYFATAPPGSPSYANAGTLRDDVDRRILGIYGGFGAGIVGVFALPILIRWYRHSGVGVRQLLEGSPAAYRDVARICSAIRHEVLKHNTTVLVSVADAMEEGDLEPARWAAEKLYGKRGAVVRFREYIADLELLGRVHGVRLNLRHRDALFGPLIDAVDRLSRLEPDLRGTPGRRAASELRKIAAILNDTGYRGLGQIVQQVCNLELSEDLLRQIFAEVSREPAFSDTNSIGLTLALPTERILLRIYQTDLEDILTNLLRNSLTVSEEVSSGRIGILVDTESDPITGLERVALRVVDDGPRRISTAMIRGRYISRGLGLAVDLISRNGGSIHVEDEEEWSKAVVVRLPRAEAGEG